MDEGQFDCSLVERLFLKEKNPQCMFSHFDNREVKKSTNQTIQHNRLSRLLTDKKMFFLVQKQGLCYPFTL